MVKQTLEKDRVIAGLKKEILGLQADLTEAAEKAARRVDDLPYVRRCVEAEARCRKLEKDNRDLAAHRKTADQNFVRLERLAWASNDLGFETVEAALDGLGYYRKYFQKEEK